MIFGPGEGEKPLPNFGKIINASLLTSTTSYGLLPMDHGAMVKARNQHPALRGRPYGFSIEGSMVYVWPIPAEPVEVRIRYFPPAVEA